MSKKCLILFGLALLILTFISTPAMAETRPIQLALVTPIQIFPEEDDITGFRLNLLYGRNVSFIGVDLGLVNRTTTGMCMGYQHGLVGIADSDFMGWQHNAVNIVHGDFQGLQMGIVNKAYSANGLQFGIVNYARTLKGLQIGLVNIIKEGGAFPFFPIVNWSF